MPKTSPDFDRKKTSIQLAEELAHLLEEDDFTDTSLDIDFTGKVSLEASLELPDEEFFTFEVYFEFDGENPEFDIKSVPTSEAQDLTPDQLSEKLDSLSEEVEKRIEDLLSEL